jgi:hypothetical protein
MNVRVTNLAQASAVLAADPEARELWSPPDAASIQGVLWFVALQKALDRDFSSRNAKIVLDCGDRADLAIEALRAGLAAVALAAPDPIVTKVSDIAHQLGSRVYQRPVT